MSPLRSTIHGARAAARFLPAPKWPMPAASRVAIVSITPGGPKSLMWLLAIETTSTEPLMRTSTSSGRALKLKFFSSFSSLLVSVHSRLTSAMSA